MSLPVKQRLSQSARSIGNVSSLNNKISISPSLLLVYMYKIACMGGKNYMRGAVKISAPCVTCKRQTLPLSCAFLEIHQGHVSGDCAICSVPTR